MFLLGTTIGAATVATFFFFAAPPPATFGPLAPPAKREIEL